MKKIFALVLAVVLVMSFTVTAFAVSSPVATKKYAIVMLIDDGTKPTKQSYEVRTEVIGDMEILHFNANAAKQGSTFSGWAFYRKDGTVANINTEYMITEGTALTLDLSFIPFNDLIVVAKYDGKEPDLTEAKKLFDTVAPQTGDSVAYILAGVLLVALCGVVITKKQLAK